MNITFVFTLLALCTFLPRYLPLALWGTRELPLSAKTVLGYVPLSILTAIFVPAILMPEGSIDLHWTNFYLISGIVTLVLMTLTKRLLLSSAIGIAVFIFMQWSS